MHACGTCLWQNASVVGWFTFSIECGTSQILLLSMRFLSLRSFILSCDVVCVCCRCAVYVSNLRECGRRARAERGIRKGDSARPRRPGDGRCCSCHRWRRPPANAAPVGLRHTYMHALVLYTFIHTYLHIYPYTYMHTCILLIKTKKLEPSAGAEKATKQNAESNTNEQSKSTKRANIQSEMNHLSKPSTPNQQSKRNTRYRNNMTILQERLTQVISLPVFASFCSYVCMYGYMYPFMCACMRAST
jgi:hypothetical protein